MAKLVINNVSLKYHTVEDEIEALHNFNLQVVAKEFISIVGPSGCGKSTTVAHCRLIKPTSDRSFWTAAQSRGQHRNWLYARRTICLNGAPF